MSIDLRTLFRCEDKFSRLTNFELSRWSKAESFAVVVIYRTGRGMRHGNWSSSCCCACFRRCYICIEEKEKVILWTDHWPRQLPICRTANRPLTTEYPTHQGQLISCRKTAALSLVKYQKEGNRHDETKRENLEELTAPYSEERREKARQYAK